MQNEGGCLQAPCLPRKTKVYVTERHACHAKRKYMSLSATLAKCYACHVKRRHMSPSPTPAKQSAAASPATNPVQARHQSQPSALSATRRRMSPSAKPARQNEGGCCQVPRLPRKVERRHQRPSAPKRAQARHQSQPNAISATLATQYEGGCHEVKDDV